MQRLEAALQQSIKSFTEFQNVAIESTGLPPNVALALSKAALEIASHSHAARAPGLFEHEDGASAESSNGAKETCGVSDIALEQAGSFSNHSDRLSEVRSAPRSDRVPEHRNHSVALIMSSSHRQPTTSIPSQPLTSLFPWTSSQQNLNFTQRYRLACVERGVQLLTTPDLAIDKIHPVLSLHLKTMTIEEMRVLALQSLYRLVPQDACGPDPAPIYRHDMFRTVEGNGTILVGRQPKREAKSLAFGCTRTVVETWMPGFEGEWLEPVDVGEYLESKGILKRRTEVGDLGLTYDNARLNIQHFIEYLAMRAVCIGPAPGVRKADVDRALARSVEGG